MGVPSQVVVDLGFDNVPPGAEPGGVWIKQEYIGTVTLMACIVLLLFFWPAFAAPLCCPCDTRMVYATPNGNFYLSNGVRVGTKRCCGHPCQE